MPGITQLAITTREYREKSAGDMVLDSHPLFKEMKKLGRIKTGKHGREFWLRARLAQNDYVQMIEARESITMGENQVLGGFTYSPKIMVVPVLGDKLEEVMNAGEEEVVEIMDEKLEIAEDSLINKMETQNQGDGTGDNGKAFAGVRTYVTKTPTLGSVGGYARGSYPQIQNIATNFTSTYGTATSVLNIESRLRIMKNDLVGVGDGKLLAFAGRDFYNYAGEAASGKKRGGDGDKLDLGYEYVELEGVRIVLAKGKQYSNTSLFPRIGDKDIYVLAPETFFLYFYEGANFDVLSDEDQQFGTLVKGTILGSIGQLCNNNPGRSAVGWDQ